MIDVEPQKAEGKVLFHFTMSLDGFVAGPDHAMDWMTGFTGRDGVEEEYIATTGAVLGGRDGWDLDPTARPYSAAWDGPIFVLTHHPEDAAPADGATFLDCDVAEVVRIGLEAAAGKNLEILSPTIGRQLLELGLIDEIDLHIAPVLLGDGIRVFDNPGGRPIRLRHAQGPAPVAEVDVRYRPVAAA
ncbi:dihydrofolate reductase family protein [Glycomyces harbinensis]|uniref:Dihydrofolate reductase n=1 Tax=Glycomyces harbinensis TaxID=58114 RepID=A0A1G7AA35_9ACTN|nr:dihydrofolate reductase family protein [Glycomyces harbinensis]SDE11620.1 Dihydrofolate reductase [Glycomyces harbinensis]